MSKFIWKLWFDDKLYIPIDVRNIIYYYLQQLFDYQIMKMYLKEPFNMNKVNVFKKTKKIGCYTNQFDTLKIYCDYCKIYMHLKYYPKHVKTSKHARHKSYNINNINYSYRFFCNYCNINCQNEKIYKTHLNSNKHMINSNMNNKYKDLYDTNIYFRLTKKADIYCILCESKIKNDRQSIYSHKLTLYHKNQIEKKYKFINYI